MTPAFLALCWHNANDALKMPVVFYKVQAGLRCATINCIFAISKFFKQTYSEHSGLVKETGFSPDREVSTLFT